MLEISDISLKTTQGTTMSNQQWKQLQHWLFDKVEKPAEIVCHFFDDHPEGVMIVNIQTEIIYYNKALGQIEDISPAEALGKTVLDLYQVADNTNYPSLRCLLGRIPLRNHACFYRTYLGKVVNSYHSVFPLFSGEKVLGCICFISNYGAVSSQLRSTALEEVKAARQTAGSVKTERLTQGGYSFDDIITGNSRFKAVIEEAKRAADTPSPVMIYGETGTGKEMMAQAIHHHSPRWNRPFLALNCAAIPETLLEGILFGTIKGAFTGALDKPGAMELASGGTLFLDEINSMPLGLQSKILRAVQEQMVRRVGAALETPVNLKIISACNIHPKMAVAGGDMRADLFYRLGVVIIAIPPLRDRRDDIPVLTRHFIAKLNSKLDKKIENVSLQVSRSFLQYHWPGNARELEHALEGAMNMSIGTTTLELYHFNSLYSSLIYGGNESGEPAVYMEPPQTQAWPGFSRREQPPAPVSELSSDGRERPEELKRLVKAMEASDGNASRAARLLGISPQLMNYRIRKYKLKKQCVIKTGG